MGFLALRCYACGMFQVKQEKKSGNKWSCAVCREKQSITKVYGTSGAAKDVRHLVQQLNLSTHVKEQGEMEKGLNKTNQSELAEPGSFTEPPAAPRVAKRSKWDDFLETEEKNPVMCEDDRNYVTSTPERRNAKRNTRQAVAGTKRVNSGGSSMNQTDINCSLGKVSDSQGKENALRTDDKRNVRNSLKTTLSCDVKELMSFDASASKQSSEQVQPKTVASVTSKWSKFLDAKMEKEGSQSAQRKSESAVTDLNKWSKYLDVEEEARSTEQLKQTSAGKWNRYLEDGMNQPKPETFSYNNKWSMVGDPCTYESEIRTAFEDEMVTDDIHPSFLSKN